MRSKQFAKAYNLWVFNNKLQQTEFTNLFELHAVMKALLEFSPDRIWRLVSRPSDKSDNGASALHAPLPLP